MRCCPLRPALLALVALAAAAAAGAQTRTAPLRPTDAGVVPTAVHLMGQPESELAPLVQRFMADRAALLRRYGVEFSAVRRARVRAFNTEWRRMLGTVNFDALGQDGRIDYVLLDNRLRSDLIQIERDEKKAAEIAASVPFSETIAGLQDTRRDLKPIDPPAAARALATIARTADSLRRIVERTPAPRRDSSAAPGTNGTNGAARAVDPADHTRKVLALRSIQLTDASRQTLEQWYRYYSGYDPVFTWWAADPQKKAIESLRAYTKAMRERILGVREGEDDPIVGDPIGEDGLAAELKLSYIAYTPADLLQIAEREFAWCEAEMRKAARAMGFGDDWKGALEKVKNSYVEPGKQPDLILALAREATDFVETRGLVSVPALAKEVWRMEMMTPEAQKVSPFFLGGEVIQVSYPTDAMAHDDKMMSMRGNNPHFSRATVQHELIPGHHLQQFMSQRYQSHRAQAFSTPFWTEGWALYWEMLLWDLDFPRSAEDRVGMLFWRMHRAARIIFSLRFHMGTMTPSEAVDFLVDRVGHERANATGEVRRSFNGNYGPLYQLAYMIGGLQFRGLHQELVGSGRMTNRQFHDVILQSGNMPVDLVRARLTGAALTRDHQATWRFAGPLPTTR